MSADTLLSPPRIIGCDVSIPSFPFYTHRDGAEHRAVATLMCVTISNIAPSTQYVAVDPRVFPFGLLESVVVKGGPSSENVVLEFNRIVMSGVTKGTPTPFGAQTFLTIGELNVDEDAQHEDIKTVRELSGHDFRYRMVAAATILALKVNFQTTPPPATIQIEFWGVNVLPKDVTVAHATTLLATNKPLAFMLPPLTPKQRFASAALTLSALNQEANNVDTSTVATSTSTSSRK